MKKSSTTIAAVVLLLGIAIGAFAARLRSTMSAASTPSMASDTNHKHLWTCGMHPQVIQDHPGNCPICHMKLTPLNGGGDDPAASSKKIAYWWDPMLGPSSISQQPGKSAMGMDLVPVFETQVQAGPGVRIDPTVMQNMGVLTAPVERGPLMLTVRAVGMLEVPEPAITDITLRVSGYIEKLYADTQGAPIARGQVLFDLYSPDVQVAAQELIGAVQVAKSMAGDASPAGRADVQRMVTSARRKLRLWGIADEDIDVIAAANQAPATVPFRSPVGGHVEEKAVVEGSSVAAGQRLMRIEDHSTLWLDAQVYEDQIESISVGEPVSATVDGLPGQVFTGTVSFVYPHMDHMTRTEIVRTVLANPEHALRPGMYATAEIITQPVTDAVLVPREAVIDTGTRQIAFVVDPALPGHFQARNVRPGISGDDDKLQIVEGLAPGEQVVTSGQFLMDVESRTTEAIQKLRAPKPPTELTSNTPAAAAPMGSMLGSGPTTTPAAALTVAHCPMKNADWLQRGQTIANPFFGTTMPTCGSVVKTVPDPAMSTPLAAVVDAYLKVSAGFDADRLDGTAIRSLQKATDAVPGDAAVSLRKPAAQLSSAATIDDARVAFAAEGAALIPLLAQ